MHELERSGHAARIDLRPFARPELLEQMTAILDSEPEPALVDRVLERSEGNPFFARTGPTGEGSLPGPKDPGVELTRSQSSGSAVGTVEHSLSVVPTSGSPTGARKRWTHVW